MDDSPATVTIIGLRSVEHGRHRLVLLSDGRELLFSAETCERSALREGLQATDDLLRGLERAERRVNAHEAALRLLAGRPRSEQEMRTRLAMRGIDPGAIDDEVQRLAASGLIDDHQFALAWVEDRKRLSPRGRRMLKYELLGRGIAPESVEAAVQDIDDIETAVLLARKRAGRLATDDYQSFYSKVGGFLRRRGFDYDVTARATRQVWAELESDSGEPG